MCKVKITYEEPAYLHKRPMFFLEDTQVNTSQHIQIQDFISFGFSYDPVVYKKDTIKHFKRALKELPNDQYQISLTIIIPIQHGQQSNIYYTQV